MAKITIDHDSMAEIVKGLPVGEKLVFERKPKSIKISWLRIGD